MPSHTYCGRGKDINQFEKGIIIGMHRVEKSSKEIAEATQIGLRTVQRIISKWKKGEETSRKERGRKKILNDRDRRSLERLVKANRRKTIQELSDMFNSGCKNISTRTMRRELKSLGYSCVALNASEAKQPEKVEDTATLSKPDTSDQTAQLKEHHQLS